MFIWHQIVIYCRENVKYKMEAWKIVFVIASTFVYSNTACPNIISKAGWGGRPATRQVTRIGNNLPYVVIHHGATQTYCYNKHECSKIVRAYQNYHIDTNQWPDIGYTFLVGEDGNVYEGRGWNSAGAHAPPYNFNSIGICFIGDFTARAPNEKAMAAAKSLIQCGVDKGYISKTYKLIGHRQSPSGSTSCPGNSLFAAIKKWSHWTPKP